MSEEEGAEFGIKPGQTSSEQPKKSLSEIKLQPVEKNDIATVSKKKQADGQGHPQTEIIEASPGAESGQVAKEDTGVVGSLKVQQEKQPDFEVQTDAVPQEPSQQTTEQSEIRPKSDVSEKPKKTGELTLGEKLFDIINNGKNKEARRNIQDLSNRLENNLDLNKLVRSDLVQTYADEYRQLMGVVNGIKEGKHLKDGYTANSRVENFLQTLEKEWGDKDLLSETSAKDETKPDNDKQPLTAEELSEKRQQLLESVNDAYNQMDKNYLTISTDKKKNRSFNSDYQGVRDMLTTENEARPKEHKFDRFGYALPEYDEKFLQATKDRSQELFDNHRESVKNYLNKKYNEQESQSFTDAFAPQVTISM
jgi:hypothetical protein